MADPASKLQNPVLMAVIGAAHGIKGELRVKTFTGDPLALGDYGPLFARDGRSFEIARHQAAGNGGRGALQGGRRPQRRRGADRHRAFRRPRGACRPNSTTRNSITPTSSAWRWSTTEGAAIGAVAAVHEFRRRRHSGDFRPGAERRAGSFHQGRSSRWSISRQGRSRSTASRPVLPATRTATTTARSPPAEPRLRSEAAAARTA